MAMQQVDFPAFSSVQFLHLGLEMRSNGTSDRWKKCQHSSQVRDFVSVYSVHPDALAAIWVDLHTCPFVDLRVDDHVTPEQIIVVYRWFNSYESENELRSSFGFPEDSIRAWCKDITAKIAGLRKIKIDPNW